MTQHDECENEPIKALAANRDTTYNIVDYCLQRKLCLYLTDMVYSTSWPAPRMTWGPINMYAKSKLAGEKSAAINPRHLILRTISLAEPGALAAVF